ncbi:MAG: ATP-binding protein, partial [Candidatus Gastranaerophilales bacterium]|nr:ATP-binding protein [Candidatus Gastranaerophilales bacterium]
IVKNGNKIYKLEDFECKNFITDSQMIINKNVTIPDIECTGDSINITIIGENNLKNITFKNQGEVKIQCDSTGKHIKAGDLNVINGEIQKDYVPKGLESVAGMSELKQQLYDDIINPLKYRDKYRKYNINPVNGFMMYGPPGCGKTFIAEKLAEETGRNFITITPNDIGSIYQHQPAMKVAEKFSTARSEAPSIVFIDEAESLLYPREGLSKENPDYNEMITEFLQQMNKCADKDVLIIMASNEPQRIDNAIKRTGRTDKKIYVGPPDKETRKELFIQKLNSIYNDGNINYDDLSDKTNNYTAEDIRMVLRTASLKALHNDKPVSQQDIDEALQEVKPSISEKLVQYYKKKGED